MDAPASNNIAEMAAVVMALLSWRHSNLLIHTDSRYVLNMVNRQLLANERDGWPVERFSVRPPRLHHNYNISDLPDNVSSSTIQRFLLYLLCSHDGYIQFKWVKAHNGDAQNSLADKLAKEAALSGHHKFSLAHLTIPSGWVDTGPVLNYQSLSFLTSSIVESSFVHPSLDTKSLPFRSHWSDWASEFSPDWLDVTHHIPNLWKINIPHQLRELLWKYIHDSLPLGRSWATKHKLGSCCLCNNSIINYPHVWIKPCCEYTISLHAIKCRCGTTLSLPHIWKGCSAYDMDPFRSLLHQKLTTLVYLFAPTTDPDRWLSGDMWFPLITLHSLELSPSTPNLDQKVLGPSRKAQEWAMGAFLWFTWHMRMKEAHSSSMHFSPRLKEFQDVLVAYMDEYTPSAKELQYASQ